MLTSRPKAELSRLYEQGNLDTYSERLSVARGYDRNGETLELPTGETNGYEWRSVDDVDLCMESLFVALGLLRILATMFRSDRDMGEPPIGDSRKVYSWKIWHITLISFSAILACVVLWF